MEKGLIHIYCGDGKGKTTAAMGLAIRAAGREKKVFITQFLKSGKSGELVSLEKLKEYITFLPGRPVNKFVWNMNDEEKMEAKREHTARFKEIKDIIKNEDYDLLILDEIIATINNGFIELNEVIDFLKNKPETLEVVMTGRDPKEELIELANYVTEMQCIKHPFKEGIPSRVGIEL
ncbi:MULTISPECIES: cob(I)yrinic acid a,c-diamide adenosyltransferase [Clostridium]|jgi:cob(I)alamin adenosyltransferase|uniref:Cob(I)yrinic acid a,c-diamide adenosyltransferase n=1 Tax=Clostridium saudiense TaxID=1414720 RepID=A0ABS2FJ94_9CLOT|nr:MULTISPECIES: cob(I)yrinic acid a,c-diamide adenosyltransferase [Clostridium]MBM6820648.1 cob(I)yrinic acid a,c-diamide adenosyltransferase [Clostridium saudiense]